MKVFLVHYFPISSVIVSYIQYYYKDTENIKEYCTSFISCTVDEPIPEFVLIYRNMSVSQEVTFTCSCSLDKQ